MEVDERTPTPLQDELTPNYSNPKYPIPNPNSSVSNPYSMQYHDNPRVIPTAPPFTAMLRVLRGMMG
ncbi:MAG: hypothetical protein JW384_01659 [Nitrosomonadaceae bacterium]|nr:hypothetical protein [Nitrosomonadaceae bacterium]